jgi:hypothetical protein
MASKYIQKYPVPQGFPDILHDFAREVLRDQPENIYEFGYLYFKSIEEVLFLRNNKNRANRLSTRKRARTSLPLRIVTQSTRIIIMFKQ